MNDLLPMYTLILILIFASPFMLLTTYMLTFDNKSFWKIFTAHTITLIIYTIFVINYSNLVTGHDEYGLGAIGLEIFLILLHVLIGFAHGLYLKFKKH